jgi:ribose transport system permease protein
VVFQRYGGGIRMVKNKTALFFINSLKSLLIVLLVYVVFAVLTKGRTVNPRTLLAVLRQSVVPTLICWALVLNMTLGIMNFAAGGVVLCALIIGGNLAKMMGLGLFGIIFFCIVFSIILSGITGLLYNLMRVPALVLTIGIVLIFESLPRIFFHGGVTIPRRDTFLAQEPWCFIVLAVMGLIFYIIYNQTAFGHNLRALGSSPGIAENVGLNSDKIKLICFLICGIFLGVAAVVYGSVQADVRNVTAMGSMTIMMDAFMGVFLAFFLAKYCDLTFAVVLGTITMKLITNGFVAMGTSSTIRDITTGFLLFILLAVSANQGWMDRLRERKENIRAANEKYALKLKAQN